MHMLGCCSELDISEYDDKSSMLQKVRVECTASNFFRHDDDLRTELSTDATSRRHV